MDDRRRALLRTIAGAAALGGCQSLWDESDPTTDTTPPPSTPDREARVQVSDRPVLADEVVTPTLRGFEPDSEVTVWGIERGQSTVQSHATVRTDADGTVDLGKSDPVAGTWDGDDEMGWVTSMRRIENLDRTHVFEGVDLESDRPLATVTGVAATVDGEQVAAATVERRRLPASVERTPVDREGIVGWYYRPTDGGTHPALLVLHGGSGRPLHPVGALFAAHGVGALVLQYFGDPEPLPDEPVGVPLSAVGSAVDWLAAREGTAGQQVGLVGWSLGAQLSLLAGSRFDRVGAVVSYAGTGVHTVFDGFDGAHWTVDGDPLPYVSIPTEAFERTPSGLATRPAYAVGFERAAEERAARATIPVEEIDGPVLLVSGGDDRVLPAGPQARRMVARFEAHGRGDAVTHLHYPEAGHRIGVPYRPAGPRRASERRVFGGTVDGLARADVESWPRVRSFFRTALGD